MISWFRKGAICALAGWLLVVLASARGADPKALIATIQAVGKEGAGNAAASTAWKSLVREGTPALEPILTSMNDDQLIASNWLRPAFEAIAEKALAEDKLDRETLQSWIANKKLAGCARALAYEWLVKLDKNSPDRLLPTMLNDPSAELRRLAVEREMAHAEKLLKEKKNDDALKSLKRAFQGACDPDQVDKIAKALDKLGDKPDLAKHYGAVQSWYLVAPFDHRKGIGWDVEYPPEQRVDLKATYKGMEGDEIKWKHHVTNDVTGLVDLNKALGKFKGAIAYAYAVIDSPEARDVELRAGCINGLKIWLNGKLIFANEEYHHGMRMDQYSARGTLKKGRNVLLLKVAQNEQKENWAQDWQYQLRICDFIGAAVPFTVVKEETR